MWASLPKQPLRIEFDGHDQIVGLRLFETDDFSFQNKLDNALQHPEVTFNSDEGSLYIVLVPGASVERTFDWHIYIDVDEQGRILAIETHLTSSEMYPERAAQGLSPNTYRPAQRITVFANRMNPTFLIKDLLADTPPRITAGMDEGELGNWLLAPDAEHIAAAYHVGAGGFDTTVGHCHALTAIQKGFDFKVYTSANSLYQ